MGTGQDISAAKADKHTIILPPPEKAPLKSGNIFKWMWYFLTPYRWQAIFFIIYRSVRYTWLSLLPLVVGYIIDALESGKAQANPEYYATFLIVFMIGYAVALYNLIFVPEAACVQKAIRGLTLYSINHINRLSLSWHENQGSGGKLQRVMTGRRGYEEILRHIRWDIFQLIGNIFAAFLSVMITDVPILYLWLYLGFIGSYLFASWYFARPYLKQYDQFNEKFENLLSGVYEFVSAIRTAKAFHIGGYINEKAGQLEKVGQQAIMRAFRTNLIRWTITNLIGGFWIFIFAWVGFKQVLSGDLSAGMYASTFFLATFIWSSCEVIGSILEKLYEYGNGMSRLITTLRVTPKNLDLTPPQSIPDNWKNITLDNVSYMYEGNKGQGVKNISFTVQRGEKIAFVGNSGAGKSTLVKLLMKQMLPDSGDFKVDGAPVSHIPTGEWLSQIGFVPQDVELFNLSIRENILIDRDAIDEDMLWHILEQAALADFIRDLPDGLETVIGERGIKLSGGQCQRLGIARALVRQAPILIFDEATSSLDSLSESKIQRAIENSFEDRTVFVIAHRLSTIRNVDKILVLDNGRIIEEGSFEKLIADNKHFAKLWAIQSQKSSEL
jgi:ATP-binding cassette subfamily B protein